MIVMNNLEYLLPIFLLLIAIILLKILATTIKYFVEEYSNFLNNLGSATPSQLKSEISKNQRYGIIKSLKIMKKQIGWSIFVLVLAIVAFGTFIVIDSRDFFKEYFETQQNKLQLRTIEAVDSMQNVITEKTFIIDSLTVLNKNNQVEIEKLNFVVKKSETSIKNLENVIKHQNTMLQRLQTTESVRKQP